MEYDINPYEYGCYLKLDGNDLIQYSVKRRRQILTKAVDLYTKDGKFYGTNEEKEYKDWDDFDEKVRTDGLYCSIVCINFKFYKLFHNRGESTAHNIFRLNELLNNSGIKSSVILRSHTFDDIDRPVLPLLNGTCTRTIISKEPKNIFNFNYEYFELNKNKMLKELEKYKSDRFYNEVVRELNWLFENTIKFIARYYMVSEKALINDNFCKLNSLNKRINNYSKNKWRRIEYYPVNRVV